MRRWIVTWERIVQVAVDAPDEMSKEDVVHAVQAAPMADPEVEEDWRADDYDDGSPLDFVIGADGCASEPPTPPLGEPTESAWFAHDGHQWATDGWCLFRRDAPRPAAGYTGCGPWRDSKPADHDLAPVLARGACRLRIDGDGPTTTRHHYAKAPIPTVRLVGDDRTVHVQRDFLPLIAAGDLWQQASHESAISVVRDGETIAVVTPIRVSP